MKLYTIQLYRRILAERDGIPVFDTTVKTGDKAFQPTWDMVMTLKRSKYTKADIKRYTDAYKELMTLSKVKYKERWLEIVNKDTVALGCYCPPGKFCHRLLLAEMMQEFAGENGIDVDLLGEISGWQG